MFSPKEVNPSTSEKNMMTLRVSPPSEGHLLDYRRRKVERETLAQEAAVLVGHAQAKADGHEQRLEPRKQRFEEREHDGVLECRHCSEDPNRREPQEGQRSARWRQYQGRNRWNCREARCDRSALDWPRLNERVPPHDVVDRGGMDVRTWNRARREFLRRRGR